jgi:hypothetical protein
MVMSSVSDVAHGGNATILIIPDDNHVLSGLTVNGVDMLNEVYNNVLILQNIQENIVIVATFEDPDAINSVYARATTVKKVHNGVKVYNAPIGKMLTVYTTSGIPIRHIKIQEENFYLDIPVNNIYIIKIDDRTFKLAL